jgi:hypothetical protein
MPTPTKRTYSLSADFPGGQINVDNLIADINASAIVTQLDPQGISVAGDDVDIWFKDPLPAADATVLDGDTAAPAGGLIASHDTSPSALKAVTALDHPTRPDGTLFSTPKASGQGFILCDRDIMICTNKVDPALAIKDWRVAADGSRSDWEEATLVGVYKRADDAVPEGALVEVANQAEADTDGVCTIIDYLAVNQNDKPNNCTIEIRGGSLYTDLYAVGLGASPLPEEHQIYAVLMPNIAAAAGGRVTFFDAYLAGYEQAWMSAISTDAMDIPHDGPAGIEGARLRVWFFYPKGHATMHHILRLVTYRTPGTF